MRFCRPCFISAWLYPGAIFRMRTDRKELCLTFDDGPDPDSTPDLLKKLSDRNIRAIFFCNGIAAQKYPGLMNAIRSEGHLAGNHGYRHLDGFKVSRGIYRQNVYEAAPFTSGNLFRPPYGRISPCQYRDIRSDYKVMFWDIMPYDFNDKSAGVKPLSLLKKMIRPGSVIVLHDTARSTALSFLDEFMEYSSEKGYRFLIPKVNEI